ncbi:MAG: hypothetical protein IJ214_12405 [Clostridia bacterium]|nr:hypothetical protein [Clostridia bacterium]
MAKFETWLKSDLRRPISLQALHGALFAQDSRANLIGVEVLDNGAPAQLSGTVEGYAIAASGETVGPIAGTLDGNRAAIELPGNAYDEPGQIQIVIRLVSGAGANAVRTVLGACTGYVQRTRTDSVKIPGASSASSVEELLSKIALLDDATAKAQDAAANANSAADTVNARIDDRIQDIVLTQDTQPASEVNKVWLKPESEEYRVPTYDEFEKVEGALRKRQEAAELVEDASEITATTGKNVFVVKDNSELGSEMNCLYRQEDETTRGIVRDNGTALFPAANQGILPPSNAPRGHLLNIAASYIGNGNLVYGNSNTMYSDTCTNEIDCSTFVAAVLYGTPYQRSRYVQENNDMGEYIGDNLMRKSGNNWIRHLSYDMAQFYAGKRRLFALPTDPYKAASMLQFGDILFKSNPDNSYYYGIHHVMLVIGTVPSTHAVIVAQAGNGDATEHSEETVCKTSRITLTRETLKQKYRVFARPNYPAEYAGEKGSLLQIATMLNSTTGKLYDTTYWTATPEFIPVSPGQAVTFTGSAVNAGGVAYYCSCFEYDGQYGYIRRTVITAKPMVIGGDTRFIRFTFGHMQSDGVRMTLEQTRDFSFAIS